MASPNNEKNPTDIEIERGPDNTAAFADAGLDSKVLSSAAQEGTDAEHSYGFVQGMKTYKSAAFWSMGKCRGTSRASSVTFADWYL